MYKLLQSIAFVRRKTRRKLRDFLFLFKRSEKVPIGITNKLRMWKNGFLSESFLIYDLKNNNIGDYISDHVRLKVFIRFNGYYCVTLYDKLYFSLLLNNFKEYLPKTYGLIKSQRIAIPGKAKSVGIERIAEMCREKGALVLKPMVGGQGYGVMMVEAANGGIILNGKKIPNDELFSISRELDDYLVIEFIKQHSYASTVFPRTCNTLRIMTVWDENKDEPFIAMAAQRFGNSKSYPVDNWAQGGICAQVDVETGVMGKAVPKPSHAKLDFVDRHPETGCRIEGLAIPHWDMIRAGILEMAATVPFIPCIGWDVVVTANGFKVIEGNNCPDLLFFQVHSPLLADPRTRRFFNDHISRVEEIEREGRRYKLPFKV